MNRKTIMEESNIIFISNYAFGFSMTDNEGCRWCVTRNVSLGDIVIIGRKKKVGYHFAWKKTNDGRHIKNGWIKHSPWYMEVMSGLNPEEKNSLTPP